MHDLKTIRENPDAFDMAMKKRGLEPQAEAILAYDETVRRLQTELQELQQQRNTKSKEIGALKSNGENADAQIAEVASIKERMPQIEVEMQAKEEERRQILVRLPNILAGDVPEGCDEEENKEIRCWGSQPEEGSADRSHMSKQHFELGEALGLMDFEMAAHLSGSRFVVLKGALARLERALANYFLDVQTVEFGFTEIVPPLLVRDNVLFGVGQLPKFEEDVFKTTDGRYLIPTSEAPLTNMVANAILTEEELPLRLTAYTPCFRSEAGSAGKDTRGMIRLHQFSKVEMVSITMPEQSQDEHERMTECAEALLKRLALPFRTMTLCSGDTGFSAEKTYDIEVWLPGQQAYREISSVSNCGAFQARRMKARFKREGEKHTEFVHTLNGSGLPIGRTMVAILENYQDAEGNICVPEVLIPYVGTEVIRQNA